MSKYSSACDTVLSECGLALGAIGEDTVHEYIDMLLGAEQVFFIGVGRVMLSLMATAKRLSHLGLRCHVVGEITEPAITGKDVLVVASGSGETLYPVAMAKKAKSLGAKVIHIGSNSHSSLEPVTDLMVRIPTKTKYGGDGELVSEQPMTSLFEQALLLFGDVVALLMIRERGIDMAELWKYHANLE